MQSIGRAAFAEFIGAFGLVFIGAGATMSGGVGLDATGIALAAGLAVTAMMTITIATSGGHLNPAITVGALLAKRVDALTAAVYIVVQLLGAAGGAMLLRALVPGVVFDAASGGAAAVAPGYGIGKAIALEAVVTFLLVAAYLVMTDTSDEVPAWIPGFAVGATVIAGSLAFAPYTGGAFNPARWFGPAFASGEWSDWLVWTVGPLVGGAIASLTLLLLRRGSEATSPSA